MPAKGMDTARDTYWRSNSATTAADWTVDLTAQMHVERVVIWWEAAADSFTVQLSDDNSAFTQEAKLVGNAASMSEFPIHTLARYVKVIHSSCLPWSLFLFLFIYFTISCVFLSLPLPFPLSLPLFLFLL